MASVPTTDFNSFDPAQIADPYPAYHQLRDEGPVAWWPACGSWLVSRHADVEAVFVDPVGFSSAAMASTVGGEGGPRTPDHTGRVLQTTDPPVHDVLRRIRSRGFTPRALVALRPRAREVVDEDLARVRAVARGSIVDLVARRRPS